ncbi:MAG: hypothetical protein AB3N14_00325 [Flavobacteriaceae bacterium]
MKIVRLVSTFLLAIPLLVFGSNYFIEFLPNPPVVDSIGFDLLQMMRDGGLMTYVALSHVVIGILLLVPRTRFAGALLQLPISIGIVSFHMSMEPMGLLFGLVLLVLNILALWDTEKIKNLL